MNEHDRDQTDDGGGPSEEPVDGERQRRAIEQQLRRFRPRPPQLDLAEIRRLADAADAPNGSVATETTADTVDHTVVTPRAARRPVAAYGGLAAAWLCGVAAGALMMFLISQRDVRTDSPRDAGAGVASRPSVNAAPAVVSRSAAAPASVDAPGAADDQRVRGVMPEPIAAADADAAGHDLSASEWDAPRRGSLRVGASLQRASGWSVHLPNLSNADEFPDWVRQDVRQATSPRDLGGAIATPTVTRDALLRSLRAELPDLTL
ncbi:MAG: hypothetical protein MUF48_11065 [Pirellulaceae bacterium]|jgi:hypothetical protein|nr:hypothetical protein [Pirellulaceae bacterium]